MKRQRQKLPIKVYWNKTKQKRRATSMRAAARVYGLSKEERETGGRRESLMKGNVGGL